MTDRVDARVNDAAIALSAPSVGPEERAAVLRVLESGTLAQGPEARLLEDEWARATHAPFAVATSSGTAALQLALLAHGIGPGDEVITSPFTFVATAHAIIHVGAKPVFVDVEEDTFNLDAKKVAAALTEKTRAIMPVHLFGQPCDMARIEELATAHRLVIVEDAAQAMGARYRGEPVGARHTSCFSLYATKNVMAGEGGIITTHDPAVAASARMLRSHGRQERDCAERPGFNLRLSELHAALGRAQLGRLGELTERRRHNAAFLSRRLERYGERFVLPTVRPERTHVWHQYTVRVKAGADERARVRARMTELGIATGLFYARLASDQPSVRSCGFGGEPLPVATRLSGEVLSLPVHPGLDAADLERVAEAIGGA